MAHSAKWSRTADIVLRAGRRLGFSYSQIAERISYKTGQTVTSNAAYSRFERLRRGPTAYTEGLEWAPEVLARARDLRAANMSWRGIARDLGRSLEAIRSHLEPEYAAHRRAVKRAQLRKLRPQRAPASAAYFLEAVETNEPRNPIYDPHRDGPLYHDSLSSMLMGDPPVGRAEIMRRAS